MRWLAVPDPVPEPARRKVNRPSSLSSDTSSSSLDCGQMPRPRKPLEVSRTPSGVHWPSAVPSALSSAVVSRLRCAIGLPPREGTTSPLPRPRRPPSKLVEPSRASSRRVAMGLDPERLGLCAEERHASSLTDGRIARGAIEGDSMPSLPSTSLAAPAASVKYARRPPGRGLLSRGDGCSAGRSSAPCGGARSGVCEPRRRSH